MSLDDLFDFDEPGAVATESPPDEEPKPKTKRKRTKKKDATEKANLAGTDAEHQPPPTSKKTLLFFDLETVPDESRIEQFDLPALPPEKKDNLLSAAEFCSQTIAEMEKFLDENMPPDWWLRAVDSHERTVEKKTRAGVIKLIEKSLGLIESQRKTLSVTPEYCRIAAAGWKLSGDEISARVFKDTEEEAIWLTEFWKLAKSVRTLVGFNILHFDLPVILIRSALLGVAPSRSINLSPFRNNFEVCDLMTSRWPKGGQMKLKSFASAMGVPVPAGDVDGSQVAELYADEKRHEELLGYVKSDVEITEALYGLLSGYFWD